MKPITTQPYTPDLLTSTEYFWNCNTLEELYEWHKHPVDQDKQYNGLLAITQNNRKLFSLIQTTIPTMDGWCSVEKACVLAALVLVKKPSTVVELGVWCGRSLLPMAFACQLLKTGMVTGIDPYSSQASADGQMGANQKWWSEQDHKAIRDKFLSFVKLFKVEDHVRLIEKPSGEVNTAGMRIQILHSDGNHGEQALHDAEKYGPLVDLGGFVICDDIGWEGGSVLRSIDEYEHQGFIEVFRRTEGGDNWCLMQRVKSD